MDKSIIEVSNGIVVYFHSSINADAYAIRVYKNGKLVKDRKYYYGYDIKNKDMSIVFDGISQLSEKYNLPVFNATKHAFSVFSGKWFSEPESRIHIPGSKKIK